jgi:AbiTii-like protein
MGPLAEIQAAVVEGQSDIAPILLKLRLLAARLGSQPLADWVKHKERGQVHFHSMALCTSDRRLSLRGRCALLHATRCTAPHDQDVAWKQ